jgi:hypothetical protein
VKITVLAPQRKKPKVGDRRTTKKHGLQIRVVETHGGMWVRSGSRYRYEWRKPADLVGTQWAHMLTAEDLADIERIRFAAGHARDMEAAILFGNTP